MKGEAERLFVYTYNDVVKMIFTTKIIKNIFLLDEFLKRLVQLYKNKPKYNLVPLTIQHITEILT